MEMEGWAAQKKNVSEVQSVFGSISGKQFFQNCLLTLDLTLCTHILTCKCIYLPTGKRGNWTIWNVPLRQ